MALPTQTAPRRRIQWVFVAVMAVSAAIVGLSVYVIVLVPDPRSGACDSVFAEFMESSDAAKVNRDGWLLYELDCNVSKRYRQYVR